MKSTKRFVGLMLALMMIFALATTAFAAEAGTITVTNPMAGQTYTAYKIFDVNYNDDQSAVSYTIDTSNAWYNVVKDFSGLTFTPVANNPTLFTVTFDENAFSAASFAAHLKAHITGKTGTELAKGGDTASASDLDLGYYFVASNNGALCNLTTTTPTATIHDKNDVPFTKVDDKESADVGEKVNYTITGKVPNTTGFTQYTYQIADTMSEGLTFDKNVAVIVGGAQLSADKYEITNETDRGFTLTIDVMALQDQVGAEIKVTYTATVNEKAVTVVSKNSATLTYSNDPTDTSKTATTPSVEETVFSAKIVINKYEKDNTEKKLPGAKFVLKNESGKYYQWDDAAKKVNWLDTKSGATEVTTNDNGAAEFKGLKNGKYFLEETQAPVGYNMLQHDAEVTIAGNDTSVNSLTVKADVENSTGTTLPETGGIGTTMFYVFGSMLVIGAATMLVVKKRMKTEE